MKTTQNELSKTVEMPVVGGIQHTHFTEIECALYGYLAELDLANVDAEVVDCRAGLDITQEMEALPEILASAVA
jgi:hypothetical protein